MSRISKKTWTGQRANNWGGIRITTLLGVALLALGVLTVYWTKKQPEPPEWIWYAGVVTAVLGGLTWWLGGMPREHAMEWIRSGLFALTLALLIRWPIAEPYRIPSGSMQPTLHGDPDFGKGDRVFVNKWIYGVRYPFMNKRIWNGVAPRRWDVVVFKTVEEDAEHKTLVKRIVGMPGERIHIADGKVHVNGKALDIPDFMPEGQFYTSERGPWRSPTLGWTDKYYGISEEEEFAVVPAGHYLVLGDNSGNSRDGRYFGWLPNEHIVGRVACIWWPPSSWRDFTGFTATLWWRALMTLLAAWLFTRLLIGRSWAVATEDGKGVDHVFVSFLAFGLRIPLTRWWALRWGSPRRGDLVLFHASGKAAPDGEPLLGRIAGLPGETVSFNSGSLRVNGAALTEPASLSERKFKKHPADAVYGMSKKKGRDQVPEGHYFVLAEAGEAEEEVVDSRVVGWVAESNVAGRAKTVWWPLTRLRGVNP